MTEPAIIPGAEPLSVQGSDVGVLVVHGFTGNPATMRPLAEALAGAGFTVEMPRLPGHGTSIEDMMTTSWEDWSATAEAAYDDLAARSRAVVVVGLSMGGTITAWLAARHPDVAGIVCINPAISAREPEVKEMVQMMVDAGETIARPASVPTSPTRRLRAGVRGHPRSAACCRCSARSTTCSRSSGAITAPLLLLTSPEDHVVEPASSDHLAASVSGPVERVSLDRSYHVATLDHDKELIAERTIAFVQQVTAV
jgi:carboxylesterase